MSNRAQDNAIHPFTIAVPESELQDLKTRLARTRWPMKELVSDWSQGVPSDTMHSLLAYWRDDYDWRRCESTLNSYPQFTTGIDGVNIHFLHIRSEHANARPLILTHGWPGSVLEFLKVIRPLTAPENDGADISDAFHLVIPTLPGFGFSEQPAEIGWGVDRIAKAWDTLMKRLGYNEYLAQGGDWGSAVTHALARQKPEGLKAIHTNLPVVLPPPPYDQPSAEEAGMLEALGHYQRWEAGYSTQQSTKPQTIGYALADSPVGQAAWIFEKFMTWTDCDGDPLNVLSYDELLDNIMMYWLTNSGASSARLYWESFDGVFVATEPVPVPCGYSVFPKELYKAPRSWAERCTPRLIHWNELEEGGHFAAFEKPALFVNEIRNCFRNF